MNYLDLFHTSYERVLAQDKKKFFGRFYEILCSQSPDIARRFENTHMSSQITMLYDSLECMIDFLVSGKAVGYLEKVARRHSRADLDIPPELYDVWLNSLIETVREYDSEFDDDVELAWRTTLSPGITYMKHHYDKE